MSGLANAGLLVRRSVIRTLRQPANLAFSFAFPLILVAVNAGGLNAATKLPGFPTDTYLSFALAVPFIQGALFAANSAKMRVNQLDSLQLSGGPSNRYEQGRYGSLSVPLFVAVFSSMEPRSTVP